MLGNIIGIIIFLAAAGGFGYLIYTRRKAKAEEKAAKPDAPMSVDEWRKRYKKPEPVPVNLPPLRDAAGVPGPQPNPAPVDPPKEGA